MQHNMAVENKKQLLLIHWVNAYDASGIDQGSWDSISLCSCLFLVSIFNSD